MSLLLRFITFWIIVIKITKANSNDLKVKVVTTPIEVNTGRKSEKFEFIYDSKSDVNFNFFSPSNEPIIKDNKLINNEKFIFSNSTNSIRISINYPTIDDFGNYTLYASSNGQLIKSVVSLKIIDSPNCVVKDAHANEGQEAVLKCSCKAYPSPIFLCELKLCPDISLWPECETEMNSFQNMTQILIQESEHIYSSIIKFNSTQPGVLNCGIQNKKGTGFVEAKFEIWDILEPFELSRSNDVIVVGDIFTIECRALIYNYTNKIILLRNGNEVKNENGIEISENLTRYSYRKSIKFLEMKLEYTGEYRCEIYDKKGFKHQVSTFIDVQEAQQPIIVANFNQTKFSSIIGDNLTLDCSVSGFPIPKVLWYKESRLFEIKEQDMMRLLMTKNNMTLKFTVLKPEDSGIYECIAENRYGKDMRSVKIEVYINFYTRLLLNLPCIELIIITATNCVVIYILLFCLQLFMNKKRKKKISNALDEAQLQKFVEGDIECIKSDIRLDEQGDLLPYDKSFDFPRNQLELRKQLGAGVFGVVKEGIALGIVDKGIETLVAVKMAKKNSDSEIIRALISELKISIFVGKHVNIVNLLGAVTENISKLELMVIYEYCRYGNLQKFIIQNSHNFINQVREDTIDVSIVMNDENLYQNNCSHSINKSSSQHNVYDSLSRNSKKLKRTKAKENNYEIEQPKKSEISFTTFDILLWSQQVARGMNYLSSRRIVHGDLAARNVLLCDDNIVKICDFGLSKALSDESYVKKNDELLPFKWMSLEAIKCRKFSVQSDIWSFGVVLWELFSLGEVPYCGMPNNATLFNKIESGYRLEKPEFATSQIYDIMQSCWRVNTELRPLFADLESKFNSLMDVAAKQEYVFIRHESYVESKVIYENQDFLSARMSIPKNDAPLPLSLFSGTDFNLELTSTNHVIDESIKKKNANCHQNMTKVKVKAKQDDLKIQKEQQNFSTFGK